jgi:L-cysteine desulfidase
MIDYNINTILEENIQPYLGCTDISIVALGASLAMAATYSHIPSWLAPSTNSYTKPSAENIVDMHIEVNESLYKNSHSTGIPYVLGYEGIYHSTAIGLFCSPEKQLNLLENVTPNDIESMKKIITEKKITIHIISNTTTPLYFHCKVQRKQGDKIIVGESCMQDTYTTVVYLKQDGNFIYQKTYKNQIQENENISWTIQDFVEQLPNLSPSVYTKLEETVQMNTKAYEYGLQHACGLGIGAGLQKLALKNKTSNDIANMAAYRTAAAEDVRMSGQIIPVMGIGGSGSHGITASIPIITVVEQNQINSQKLYQSIALSFLITEEMRKLIGYLTVPCGCIIKAGVGATAGIAFALDGTILQIENAINNFLTSTAGVICDGGKTTCSIKLANAANNACKSAFLALENVFCVHEFGGIVQKNFQKNLLNLTQLSKAMQPLDTVIIQTGFCETPRIGSCEILKTGSCEMPSKNSEEK